jgi:DNA-binding GntR family transcriptional regulator
MSSTMRLQRVSIVDELAGALRARVLDGELDAGTPLREEELSSAYGVSRHTLRAALRSLAADGLITIEPNRGARVATLSSDELYDLFALRTALELEAAHLVLVRDEGHLPETVHRALTSLTAACNARRPSWRRVATAHAGFHGALVEAAGSPRLAHAYGQLAAELRLFLLQLRPVWPVERMVTHHEELVVALERGDLGALRRHLEDGLDAIRAG